jgi:small-conductance mechanosensitive channel
VQVPTVITNQITAATNQAPTSVTIHEELQKRWLDPKTYIDLSEHLITTILIISIAIIVSALTEAIIRKIVQTFFDRRSPNSAVIKKITTIQSIIRSTVRYSIACVALFRVLLIWGVPNESLTVGSAILASAIGFGSQGLIQDMITGFSLLFEEQLRIGDFVEINGKQGFVREVGLRVVRIQALDGTEHIMFNRQITMVSNLNPPGGSKS